MIILMAVDLPAPFGPRSPKISPSSTDIVKLSTAVSSPKRRVKWSVERIGVLLHQRAYFSAAHEDGANRRHAFNDNFPVVRRDAAQLLRQIFQSAATRVG